MEAERPQAWPLFSRRMGLALRNIWRFVLGEYFRFVDCATVFILRATWWAEWFHLTWTRSRGERVQTEAVIKAGCL